VQRPCGVNAVKSLRHLHFNLTSHASFVLLASPLRLVRLWSRSRPITVAAFGTLAHADRATGRIKERDRMNFIARLRALLRDTSGQDLLEYALLVALIALVCVAVITSTGTNVQSIFTKISAALSTAATPTP